MAWERRALVVIHGIGVQAPRSTLRSFVAGLASVGGTIVSPEVAERVAFGEPERPAPARVEYAGTRADVYEVYWAPRASRKTTARSVLAWILRLTFVPGSKARWARAKNLFDAVFAVVGVSLAAFLVLGTLLALVNLTDFAKCVDAERELTPEEVARCELAFADVETEAPAPAAGGVASAQGLLEPSSKLERLGDVAGVLWRAVRRVPAQLGERSVGDLSLRNAVDVVTAIPVQQVFLLALLVWVIAQVLYRVVQVLVTGTWARRASSAGGLLLQGLLLVALVQVPGPGYLVGIAVVLVALLFEVFVGRRARATGGESPGGVASSVNSSFAALGLALVIVLAQYTEPIYVALALLLAFAWAVVRGTAGFLSESIGDVQVYTTRNPNSAHYATRGEILAEAERVFGTVAERGYESIVVVGHSLGAVVGFEAVENLKYRIPDLVPKIEAFVTLGSAVEKVNYFFGQDPRVEAASVGSVAEEALPGKTAEQRELDSAVSNAKGRPWLNLWYWNDVVADPIFSFGTPERRRSYAWYRIDDRLDEVLRESREHLVVNVRLSVVALWSHSRYWIDRRVLRVIAEAAFPSGRPEAHGVAG